MNLIKKLEQDTKKNCNIVNKTFKKALKKNPKLKENPEFAKQYFYFMGVAGAGALIKFFIPIFKYWIKLHKQ